MKATLKNDDDKGRGHALLIVHFAEEDEKLHQDEALGSFFLAVKGHPSGTFLQGPKSEERWTLGSEEYLPVVAKSWDGTDLILELGPYFTNAFQEKIHSFFLKGQSSKFAQLKAETYRVWKPPRDMVNIDLPDPNAKFTNKTTEAVTLMNRTAASASSGEARPSVRETPPSPPSPPVAAPPVVVPPAPPVPSAPLVRPPDPAPTPAAPVVDKKSHKGLKIGVGVLLALLLLAGGFIWYYLGNDNEVKPTPEAPSQPPDAEKTPEPAQEVPPESAPPAPAPPESAPPESAPPESAPPESTPPEPAPPESAPPSAPSGDLSGKPPIDAARNLLRTGAANEDLAAAVAKLDGQPGAEDAVFLLLRKLAPTSPESQMRFAAFFDPLDSRPTGSVVKNAKYAYDEYEVAKKAGHNQAAERQKALIKWADANAASGDEGARALLEWANNLK
ncbi:MAG: hypothetical protein LBT86_03700 [Deltaproteobacteria bacterium]|jgi:hypothetical protein|nr:hypothetical protein [Deltaproteobacteria bacterium]